MLAVAIALWRAHGDNVAGSGILEYYRRLAAGSLTGRPASGSAAGRGEADGGDINIVSSCALSVTVSQHLNR